MDTFDVKFPVEGAKAADGDGRVWTVRGGPWVEVVAAGGSNKVVRLSEVAAWGEPAPLAERVQSLEAEKSAVVAERNQLAVEKARLIAEKALLVAEKEALVAEVEVLRPVAEVTPVEDAKAL